PWLPSWNFGAIAAIAIFVLAVSVGYSLHRTHSPAVSSPTAATTSRQPDKPKSTARTPQQAAQLLPAARLKRGHVIPSTSAPQVIVLVEERQAFVKFVAEVPRDTAVAMALTRPTPPETNDSVEIATLRIDPLEVRLLDGSPSK
ncbi:MAG: hypothetical protein WBW49_07090, partial [Candidatus Acidiferrum sp.]